jgi:D-sedoheptulose 7-phosphate isomerase
VGHLDAIRAELQEAAATLDAALGDPLVVAAAARFADELQRALAAGRRVFACGNGGSMAEAMHFAEEWSGRFRDDRQPLPAQALSDPAALTAIANDYGFAEVFARQIEAHGGPGDVLVLLSTSGQSENLIRAAEVARRLRLTTIALLGRGGGKLRDRVDVAIVVPRAATADRVQEAHLQIMHAVIAAVEQKLLAPASNAAD